MSTARRNLPGQQRQEAAPGLSRLIAVLAVMVLLLVAAGAVWFALWAGARLDGRPNPGAPPQAIAELLTGKTSLAGSALTVLIAVSAVIVLALVLVLVLLARRHRRRARVDDAARHLGRGRDVAQLRRRTAGKLATRLGVDSPGLPLGDMVSGDERLFFTWEDMAVAIFGPRQGKTTSYCINWIVEAPGCVLSTSNKRDVLDATRDVRAAAGPMWVFDPQGIAHEQPTVYWNPLSYIRDVQTAEKLSNLFADAGQDPDAAEHPYFGPARRALLTDMLLAAAIAGEPITQVFIWLARENDQRPVDVLQDARFMLIAEHLTAQMNLPPEQKKGVWGGALSAVGFLRDPQITEWITSGDRREQFYPARFVDENAATVYLLSKNGSSRGGSAAPVVTALSVAIMEAAEQSAEQHGGRLPVPLVAVLDEAANVCPWRELPDQYSHYGSKGIQVLTILQSYAQGEKVWGAAGMRVLWSAATVRILGSGISEPKFLTDISDLIGDYRVHVSSTSRDHSGMMSRSTQVQRERILDTAALAEMPRGRALILSAGSRATLVKTIPWMSQPRAAAISASVAAHDPGMTKLSPREVVTAAWEAKWPAAGDSR